MENPEENRKFELGEDTLKIINRARKWTMFLAVAGFIFLGLIVVMGLLTGTFLSAFNHGDQTPGLPDLLLIIGFAAAALIIFFPVFSLFRFSTHAAAAVHSRDPVELHKAFRYLRRFFRFLGIILILAVAAYIAGLVIAGSPFTLFR